MIHYVENSEYKKILNYISSNDIKPSPYIVVNLSYYKTKSEEYTFYCQTINNRCTAFISVYSKVVQLWVDDEADLVELREFMVDNRFKAVYSIPTVLEKMNYSVDKSGGQILVFRGKLVENSNLNYSLIKEPTEKEYRSIAHLLVSDPESDSHSDEEITANRYRARREERFGRSYVLLNGNGDVIAHVGTHGESDNVAIIGGVITKDGYRKQGLATFLITIMCDDLIKEKKEVYLYSFNKKAIRLYEKIGFTKLYDWGSATINYNQVL